MIIGRLRANGAHWREWVETSRYRATPNVIHAKHGNRRLLTQQPDGQYEIHPELERLAAHLQLT